MKSFSLGVLLVWFASVGLAGSKRPSNARELFGTEENLAIVTGADRVDACLLRYIPPPKPKVSGPGEHYEETEFVTVSSESIATIRNALLSDSTYEWEGLKACWPRYQTRLRFQKADRTITVDFCFGCDVLLISRDGRVVSGGSFDPKAYVFIAEIKRLFPKARLP